MSARGQHAVLDGAGQDEEADPFGAQPVDVPIRVERLARPRQEEMDDAIPGQFGSRGVDRDSCALRHVLDDPAVRGDAGVGLRQVARLPDRPRQRHGEQEQRHRRDGAQAACERAESRDQREHVAVEVRVDGHQLREVHEAEHREDEIRAGAMDERQDQPDRSDHEHGPERVPEELDECDRRRRVVLEAEPALAGRALHAGRIAHRVPEPQDHVRARHGEGDERKGTCDREPTPSPPRSSDQWSEEDQARILRARREPDRDAGQLDAAHDHQRERDRDAEGQGHIGDGHARVGDVRGRDRGRGGSDEAGQRSVGLPPEPPGGRDSRSSERNHDDTGREVRRLVVPGLERGEDVHDERRVVEPTRIGPGAVRHRPGTRDDVPLVGVQERERQAVADAHQAQRNRTGEQGDEREPRAAPPALAEVRPPEAPH